MYAIIGKSIIAVLAFTVSFSLVTIIKERTLASARGTEASLFHPVIETSPVLMRKPNNRIGGGEISGEVLENRGEHSKYRSSISQIGRLDLLFALPAGREGYGRIICTGTMLFGTHVLTARHCLEDAGGNYGPSTLVDGVFFTSYLNDIDGPGIVYDISVVPQNHIFPDMNGADADFVLLAIERNAPSAIPTDNIRVTQETQSGPVDAYILHHPKGHPLRLSLQGCIVSKINRCAQGLQTSDLMYHVCGTDGGSSGAPVFDASHDLIGMHIEGRKKGSQDYCGSMVPTKTLVSQSQFLKDRWKLE